MNTPHADSSAAPCAIRKPSRKVHPEIPPELADVAMVSFGALVAASGRGRSAVKRDIKAGIGPQPLRFGPRHVLYRLSDARRWLIERAARAEESGAALAASALAGATRASQAAREKRAATVA